MANTTTRLLLLALLGSASSTAATASILSAPTMRTGRSTEWSADALPWLVDGAGIVPAGPGGHTNQDGIPGDLGHEHTNQDRSPPPPPVRIRPPRVIGPDLDDAPPPPWGAGAGVGPDLEAIPLSTFVDPAPGPGDIAAFGDDSQAWARLLRTTTVGGPAAGPGLQPIPGPGVLPFVVLGALVGGRRRRAP